MEQVDIQPYLGFNEADGQESPLNFEHLLSKDKVSRGLVQNFSPWVPLYNTWKNFAGAKGATM